MPPALEAISDIYSITLKNLQGDNKSQLIVYLINSARRYINKKADSWKIYTFNLCTSILEASNYEELSCYWGHIMDLFVQYCNHKNYKLRSIAVYGMGLIFERTPIHLVQ